jgi:hypothetical protein
MQQGPGHCLADHNSSIKPTLKYAVHHINFAVFYRCLEGCTDDRTVLNSTGELLQPQRGQTPCKAPRIGAY